MGLWLGKEMHMMALEDEMGEFIACGWVVQSNKEGAVCVGEKSGPDRR